MIASLIIALHLFGILTLESATTSLYVAGALLIIAEIGVVSFGLLFLNGIIALYAGYTLQIGNDLMFGISIGWPVLFGIAFVEILVIATVILVHIWLRKQKATTGVEGMIGAKATILSWEGKNGQVRFEGEIWNADADAELDLSPNDEVVISAVNKMKVTITA